MGKYFWPRWLTIITIISAAPLFSAGCSSLFVVKSDPIQADVSILDPQSGEKKPIGKTPVELKTSVMKETVGEAATSGEFFTVLVEKPGYASQRLMVPASKFGILVTQLDIKLKPSNQEKEERTAKDVLTHLFLAQKLALAKQYERAQTELDKILTDYPDFPRALSMRGSIYFLNKNYSESLKWYELTLKADPQMEDAIKMISKIKTLQGVRVPASTSPTKRGKP